MSDLAIRSMELLSIEEVLLALDDLVVRGAYYDGAGVTLCEPGCEERGDRLCRIDDVKEILRNRQGGF